MGTGNETENDKKRNDSNNETKPDVKKSSDVKETKEGETTSACKNAGNTNNLDLTEPTLTRRETDPDYVTPPDGGWGWVVVASSFLIHVIADGIVYSFGVFLMEFVDYFNAGRGETAWIGALQPAVTFTVGPLSSALTNKYGCRKVTIAGSLIASAGFILSIVTPNLYFLYFSAGIMAGLGFGLIYLPAIVCVAQYFERRRSFATGLAVCGSGFGTFLLAPITEMLVHEYSWRGAMLILGGIILNIAVCGILFRPLEAPSSTDSSSESSNTVLESEREALLKKQELPVPDDGSELTNYISEKVLVKDKEISAGRGQGEGGHNENIEMVPSVHTIPASFHNGLSPKPKEVTKDDIVLYLEGGTTEADSVSELPLSVMSDQIEHVGLGDNQIGKTNTPANSMDISVLNQTKNTNNQNGSEGGIAGVASAQNLSLPEKVNALSIARSDGALHLEPATNIRYRTRRVTENSHSLAVPGPLERKDIFYSGSLQNIPMYRSHPEVYIATVSPVGSQTFDSEDFEDDERRCCCVEVSREFGHTIREMLSGKLLRNPVFLLFAVSNFFTSIGFNMPFIFLPDRAKLAGIDENRAALLLSVIGIANTCGRVFFGFLSDQKWVHRLFLYNTALAICGLATALSPLIGGSYGLLIAYAAVFGIFIGVYVSLTSVVLVDLLGLEHLTNSFGLLLLFQGAATFVGPPLAGLVFDWTGSYDISFAVMGSLIAMSGIMLYFLPLVERYYNKRKPLKELVHSIELGQHPVGDGTYHQDLHQNRRHSSS